MTLARETVTLKIWHIQPMCVMHSGHGSPPLSIGRSFGNTLFSGSIDAIVRACVRRSHALRVESPPPREGRGPRHGAPSGSISSHGWNDSLRSRVSLARHRQDADALSHRSVGNVANCPMGCMGRRGNGDANGGVGAGEILLKENVLSVNDPSTRVSPLACRSERPTCRAELRPG